MNGKVYPARTFRLHIGIYGKRNAGKSSILNALTGQRAAIVSDVPGTTTDPVEKVMELLPLGPVTFIDTAGVDDEGDLGARRIERTRLALERTDVAIIVSAGAWTRHEADLLAECKSRNINHVLVRNKCELGCDLAAERWPEGEAVVKVSCAKGDGIAELRSAIVEAAPDEFVNRASIMADLVPPDGVAVFVVPVDKEAPKGRLILPQVQCLREMLDNRRLSIVATDEDLPRALDSLRAPPSIVVTDSQAFLRVSEITPVDVPLTSFSILFARFQGDLGAFAQGASVIPSLRPGDKVLIAEACTHHPVDDDIGTVKIPRIMNRKVGGELAFSFARGPELPANLREFKLVVNCGGCVWNRRAMLSRIGECASAGVPISNYGMVIASCLGIMERAMRPFRSRTGGEASL